MDVMTEPEKVNKDRMFCFLTTYSNFLQYKVN